MGEERLGLVDAAEHALLAGEDLHDHDRVEAFTGEDLFGASEVDVRGLSAEDVMGWRPTFPAHGLHVVRDATAPLTGGNVRSRCDSAAPSTTDDAHVPIECARRPRSQAA